jgi:mannose-6-phosphate isomerase-like protein (cupin superfamily)
MPKREKRVFQETDVPFVPVDWGRTKVLIGTKAGGDADNLYVAITEYLPGKGHLMHAHHEDDEIMLIVSGRGYTLSDGVRKDLVPGTVVEIPAGTMHENVPVGNEPLRAFIVKAKLARMGG